MRTATARFMCDAQSRYGPKWATCNNHITVDLFNDGQYDNFNRPEGWHIELGTSPERTIVRCPSCCTWVGSHPHPDTGEEIPAHWEDAPAVTEPNPMMGWA